MRERSKPGILDTVVFSKPGKESEHYCEVNDAGSAVTRNKGKDSSGQLRCALTLIIISIVLTISVLLVAVVFFKYGHRSKEATELSMTPIACLECSNLSLGLVDDVATDDLLRKLSRRIEDKIELCCAYNSEQMSAMFEAVMRRQEPPTEPLPSYNVSDFKFSSVSAHKRIYPEFVSTDFRDIHIPQLPRVCHFNPKNFDRLEHHRGVSILDKGVEIRHAGLYYVYSSVNFRPQSTWPCKDFDFQTFTHSVWHRNWFGDTQMLKTTHTCCDDCANNPESRFTGGAFRLERGDIIQVKVMEYRLVHFEPQSSFAGLAMIGEAVDKEDGVL